MLVVKGPKITAQQTGQKHLQRLALHREGIIRTANSSDSQKREQNCLCLRRVCPLRCVTLQDSSLPLSGRTQLGGECSSQGHNTTFVRLSTLSCGAYVAIRISTIHLEGDRHLHISAQAFRVCQECLESCTGGGLLVSSNTTHKSISTPL